MPAAARRRNTAMRVSALDRVRPVERLVEDQDKGVGDECRGHLGALPHTLAEAGDGAIGSRGEVDGLDGLSGPLSGTGEVGGERHELARGEDPVHGVLLGDESHVPIHGAGLVGRSVPAR